ncbi:MAG: MarR family winged helix-turn-helix transcriptional regulator [bacterium]
MTQPGFDSRIEQFFDYLDTMVERFTAIKRECLQDYRGLSLQALMAVRVIGKKESCIMREVAASLQLAVNTATTLVDKLVAMELVVRHRSDEDRRIVKVALTEKGKDVFLADREVHKGFTRAMLNTLDEAEQEIFISLMRKISKNLK